MEQQQQKQQIPFIEQLKQQTLNSWQPLPSLTKTIITFFIFSTIFLSLGIPMFILSNQIQQYTIRYDNMCQLSATQQCSLNLTINQNMEAPIFVYYELDGFYQNHRLYSKSISYKQLQGETLTTSQADSQCAPIVYNKNLYRNSSFTNNTQLNPQAIANPCGLIPYTIFNDSFTLFNQSNQIPILDSGIAWPNDIPNFILSNPQTMWYNITSQRFINWIRISSTQNFRKLWGRIQNTLISGNYTLIITNIYNLTNLSTKKLFVLSQSNLFGSKNQYLSIVYIVVGSACLFVAIVLLFKKIIKNHKIQ